MLVQKKTAPPTNFIMNKRLTLLACCFAQPTQTSSPRTSAASCSLPPAAMHHHLLLEFQRGFTLPNSSSGFIDQQHAAESIPTHKIPESPQAVHTCLFARLTRNWSASPMPDVLVTAWLGISPCNPASEYCIPHQISYLSFTCNLAPPTAKD